MSESITSLEQLSELSTMLATPYDSLIASTVNSVNTLTAVLGLITNVQDCQFFADCASADEVTYLNNLTTVINTFIGAVPTPPVSS